MGRLGPGEGGGQKERPPLVLPGSCFIDEHVTRVAWLNRSNILYAGNDRWTSDPRVRLLINTPEEFSILITQVGLGDEGLYTCSFQTRHQPYTTQVYLIVHGEGPQGAARPQGTASREPDTAPPSRTSASGRDSRTERDPSVWQLLGQESQRRKRRPHSLARPCLLSTYYAQALLQALAVEKGQSGCPRPSV